MIGCGSAAHGECTLAHPSSELRPGADAGLAVDAGQVGLHRRDGREQSRGDFAIGPALGHECGNASLCCGEPINASGPRLNSAQFRLRTTKRGFRVQ